MMPVILCFILLPVVVSSQSFQYKISVLNELHFESCKQLNSSDYQCDSLQQALQLLSNSSTDIVLDASVHHLKFSNNISDLQNIRIRSKTGKYSTIQCAVNTNVDYNLDTGIAFIRVRNLVIEHINILGCGMKHVSSNEIRSGVFIVVRSALYVQNSTNIALYNMSISNSNGIGLLIYDTNGTVNITNTFFIGNKLNVAEQNKSFTGGGGVYVQFTECSPGLHTCDPHNNPYSTFSTYIIDHCRFEDNVAVYTLDGSQPEELTNKTFITFGTGGGISYWIYGNAYENTLQVRSSSFNSNIANFGAGINVRSKQNAKHNHISIENSSFTNNTANGQGGGGGVAMGYVIYQEGGESMYNSYVIASCIFQYNKALNGVGGGLVSFGSREPRTTEPTNRFEILNSQFIGNEAVYGSAIELNKEFFESILVGTIFTLVIENCSFINNGLRSTCLRSANVSSVGAISSSGVNIRFSGSTLFSGNNATALAIDGALVEFGHNSFTNFSDNHGLHSGGIQLISSAWIKVYPNCTVLFIRNTAVHYGGAIYVELSTPFDYLLSHVCFVRYYSESTLLSEWNFTFIFDNNRAGENNSTMFVTTIQPCIKAYSENMIASLVVHGQISSASHLIIATAPAKFIITNSTIPPITPGEVFDLNFQLVDELEQNVTPVNLIATCKESHSPYVMSPYHFTNGTIQIAGKPTEVCHLTLQTDTNYQISTTLHITLSNCPPGFTYNERKAQCECMVNRNHQNPAITGCELASFQAYFNQFYWIGYDSDNLTNLLTSSCPYGYCYKSDFSGEPLLPRHANKSSLDQFVCGDRKRTGLLCGRCIDGYSVALNSPIFKCHHCTNHTIGILYLFLSCLLPVSILFYFIMAYNIRITTGPIGAFLFFSQVVSSQYHYEFDCSLKDNSNEILTTSNIILSIYSVSNLDFFHHNIFSYCLFSSAGTVDILAFNLLLSLYPVLLVFVYFLLRRHCNWTRHCRNKFRLSRGSVTHGICAFLILSFAKINALAFGILNSVDVNYMNGTLHKRVVYLQGDIEYFKNARYNVYAAGSLFTITTVVLIPTLILVLHPIMISVASFFKWGDSKFITFINKCLFVNKLKPLLDSFQGDYKDNLSLFAGLHSFLYRIVFFSVVVVASTLDVNLLVLITESFLLTILVIHVVLMPFKKSADNAVYSLMYSTLLAILIIEYYLFTTGESSDGLLWLQTALLSLPLVCAIVYYFWKLFVVVQMMWKKHSHRRLELVSYVHFINQ